MTVKLMECCFGWEVRKLVSDINVDENPLWSSALVHSHRSQCVETYRSLIKAGADIILAPTYQATIWGIKKYLGFSEEQAISYFQDMVSVCKEAIELEEKDCGKSLGVRVTGVIGSYGAHLHDGSEYTGKYPSDVDDSVLSKWHSVQLSALSKAGVDAIAFGTCPRMDEALVFVDLIRKLPYKIDAWVSFSTKEAGKISSGENFVEVASKVWDTANGTLTGVGVNCCHATIALEHGRQLHAARPDIAFIPIPNNGDTFDSVGKRWIDETSGKSVSDYVEDFIKLGIKQMGCCCRNYSEDIAAVRKKIDDYKEA